MSDSDGRTALVCAHPGHELRVHHWLEQQRPIVSFLTDGSGSSGTSRLASSGVVLAAAAARPGQLVFGRWTDRDAYRHLMNGRFDAVRDVVTDLASEFEREGVTEVAGDAAEGFNPVHDLCRSVINATVSLLRGRGRAITNLEFDLSADPDSPRNQRRLLLDDSAFERKLATLSHYPELAGEGASAIETFGAQRFRVEGFREVAPGPIHRPLGARPEYERIGEQRVLDGRYPDVLRYEVHLLPLLTALQGWVEAEIDTSVAHPSHQ